MEVRWEPVRARRLTERRHGPGARWGHTCNTVERVWGRLLYLFGGWENGMAELTSDVHVYDTKSRMWNKPLLMGVPPCPRQYHTCTTVGSNLFVFGGTNGESSLGDLHILDTISNEWIAPATEGDGPGARESHSAVLVGSRLFIFGGSRMTPHDADEVLFNDLHILDTSTMRWMNAATSGRAPEPRDSHTMSYLPLNNTLIVFGGEDSSNSCLSDMFTLHTETLSWERAETTDCQLIPRAGHIAEVISKNYLFIFGGYGVAEQVYNNWQLLLYDCGGWRAVSARTAGRNPSPRFSLAGTLVVSAERVIVLHGGCNERLEALPDIHYMRLEFTRADTYEEEYSPRKVNLRGEPTATAANSILRKRYRLKRKQEQDPELPTIADESSGGIPSPGPSEFELVGNGGKLDGHVDQSKQSSNKYSQDLLQKILGFSEHSAISHNSWTHI